MLPWIAGAIVLSVGTYLLNDEKSSNSSSRRRYKREHDNSVKRIDSGYKNTQKKDKLDKLFKVKRAKQEIADSIYFELKSDRESLANINLQLKESKAMLSTLFEKKHSTSDRYEKRDIQANINIIMDTRRELFKVKDGLALGISGLKSGLQGANMQTKAIQDEINKIVD